MCGRVVQSSPGTAVAEFFRAIAPDGTAFLPPESAAEKPSFRQALKLRRCLIPVDGLYEWKKEGTGKTPYCIKRADGKPFAFAGLWDRWVASDGEVFESFTILTTEANDLMKPLHHRMPVILRPEEYDRWLDPRIQEAAAVQPLLRPYSDDDLVAYPVSKTVNNPRNETPACIEPAST